MTTSFSSPRTAGGNVELLSIELLEEHARRLAALLSINPRGGGDGRLHLRQLKTHMRALRAVYNVLADYRTGHPETPLEVRIGVHAGEVERDGNDVVGRNVFSPAGVDCGID